MTAATDATFGDSAPKVLALCGGVGGAKLALGLARVLPPEDLLLVVNTGDDFDHLGLRICPDLDTVTYTLAGCVNPQTGWGRAGETGHFLQELAALGGESWFFLGDRDLALHVERTRRLARGESLSAVTRTLAARFKVSVPIIPMTDDSVATEVDTAAGTLAFQHYFVREQCRPVVTGIRFAGAAAARPHPRLMAALAAPALEQVILCPSNPFLSMGPILALPGVRAALAATAATVVVVSPIVGGSAVKGPTAKIMAELGYPVSSLAVAEYYRDLIDGFLIDQRDQLELEAIERVVPDVRAAQTLMLSLGDRLALARETLYFGGISRKRQRGDTR